MLRATPCKKTARFIGKQALGPGTVSRYNRDASSLVLFTHPSIRPMSQARSKILIADDNPTNVELLEAYLIDLDCDIAIAEDGQQTLDQVAQSQPDVILLDIMMPKVNGFEVCKQLKGNPATSGIMILMVTALGEEGDIERAVAAGTDDFLSKPIHKVELVKRVQNMLRLRHVVDEVERLRQYINQMEDASGPQ